MAPEGSNQRRLTFDETGHRPAAWSPDGRCVAFSSRLNGEHALYTVDVNTSTVGMIASGSTASQRDRLSPAFPKERRRLREGDAREPAREAVRRPQLIQPFVRRQERLLLHILGVGAREGLRVRKGEHGVLMPSHKLCERIPAPAPRIGDE